MVGFVWLPLFAGGAEQLPSGSKASQVYVGGSLGLTHLSTEFANRRRTLVTDTLASGGVTVGVDVSPHVSIEAGAVAVDRAAVSQDGKLVGGFGYRDYNVSTVGYLLRSQKAGRADAERSQSEGFAVYGRLGAGYKVFDSPLAARDAKRSHLLAGLGAEYGWASGVGARAEVSLLGSDAKQLQFSLLKRFTVDGLQPGTNVSEAVTVEPALWNNRLYVRMPTIYFRDEDPRTPLNRQQQKRLDALAAQLLRVPGLEIEVRGHSRADLPLSEALRLSRRRAITVSRYLQSKGIKGNRLHVRAYGGSEPQRSPDGSVSPARNRRVDFAVFSG